MEKLETTNMTKKILLLTKNIEKIRSISIFLENKGFAVEIATSLEQVQQLSARPYAFSIQIRDFIESFQPSARESIKKYLAHIPMYKINDPLLNPKLAEDLLKIAISNIGKLDPAELEKAQPDLLPIDEEQASNIDLLPNISQFQDINHHVNNLDLVAKNILFTLEEQMTKTSTIENLSSNDYLNIAMVKVFDPNNEGCFLLAIPERVDSELFDKQIEKLHRVFSKQLGASIKIEIIEEKVRKEVYDDIKRSSQKVIEGHFDGQDLLVSFFKLPAEKVKNFETIIKNEMCLVEVEQWWSKVPLPVNAYIFLELNNKKILYIRNGQAVPNDLSERLNAKSQNHLWIEERELHKYKQFRYLMSLSIAP